MAELFDCNNTSLKKNAKGAKVTLLQTYLKQLGYYTASIDGSFGPVTEKAVKSFQKATNNTVDGWFGPKTCKSLNEKIDAKNTATSTVQTTQVFDCPNVNLYENNPNNSKDLVTKLQTELKKLGYYTRQVDGDFGPYTTEAVKKFQKAKGGLLTDGVFGPATCKKLGATTTETKVTTAVAKATEPPKDPYAVDVSRNVLKAEESNLSIDGLYFSVSGVTFTNPFKTKRFQRIDMMDGSQKKFQTNATPREYSVDCILSVAEFEQLKNEFYKMQNRDCKVVTSLFESGTYNVEVGLAYQNVGSRKVTLKLLEVI